MDAALPISPAAGGPQRGPGGETTSPIPAAPHRSQARRKRSFLRLLLGFLVSVAAISALAVATWIGYRTWPRTLSFSHPSCLPAPEFHGNRLVLRMPQGVLLGEVGAFRDEVQAYLRFEYVKSLKPVDEHEVVLTATETGAGPEYRIDIVLPNDLLTARPYLAQLQAERYISGFDLDFASPEQLAYRRQQTDLFDDAYSAPVRRKLEQLSPSQLVTALVRFMIFKSKTDRRVREEIEPVPVPLSSQSARELAADIITVARFYRLPLDFFLGIGAMENNYMNVNGDLRHVLWKRRAQKGDIVLRRWRGRVLVSDYSVGVWQVTQQRLRYVHELYLKDRRRRDYSALPVRLQPSLHLEDDRGRPEVLTTYAGLLFRELLDRCGGDVTLAVGAYNGGLRHPNFKYAAGVQMVADYARRILEHACALNGEALDEAKFVVRRSPRPPGAIHGGS